MQPPIPSPTFSSLIITILLGILVVVWLSRNSMRTILEDEIAYQDSEITRLEKLVVKSRYTVRLEDEVHRLYALMDRHQNDVAYLTAEVRQLEGTLQDIAQLWQEVAELAEMRIGALFAEVEEQRASVQAITARYNTECAERAVAVSMNWAMKLEIEELQQTVKKRSQSVVQYEAHQATIETLKEYIKTAARLGAEQETHIRRLVEQITIKEEEKEEVAMLAEKLAVQSEAACEAQRRKSKKYIREMKTKWAAVWGWASEEMRELRSRLGELMEVDQPDDSFISMAYLFADLEADDDGSEGMSICSVLENVVDLVEQPTPEFAAVSMSLPWVPSPSKTLAGRRLGRKISLSANPPDSPFAFATNSIRFAPADVKWVKQRSAKRVKVDRGTAERA